MMLGSTDLHLSPILVNRRHRRLTDEELEQAVVMALDQGLIEAADHYQVTPADLHRVANQPRFRPLPRASRNRKLGRGRGRGSAPFLDREQAEAARDRARLIGAKAAARELGMSTSGLRSTWHRLGIELPGHPRWLVAHPNARALTRDQAVAALERALEVGRDRVAEELGITRWTLTKNWHYWGLQGPGREHAATIRWRRVRAQEPPCRRSRPGSEGAGDPSRSAERLQLDDVNFVNGPGSGSARAHAMLTHDPAPTGIGDRIGNTTGPVHPS